MKGSAELQNARNHLNKVNLLDHSAERHIDEGFYALERVAGGGAAENMVAENLARTYIARFHSTIKEMLLGKQISEPQLKTLLHTVRALESTKWAEEFDFEPLRVEIAKKLIDAYFQGYTPSERSKMVRDLMHRINTEGE